MTESKPERLCRVCHKPENEHAEPCVVFGPPMTEAEEQVEHWNRVVPAGSYVSVRLDSGEFRHTHTRSSAFVSSSGDAVIHVVGVPGWYLLNRVIPVAVMRV